MFGNSDNLVRLAEILAKNPIQAPNYTYSETTNDPASAIELTSKVINDEKIFSFKNPIPGAGIKLKVRNKTIAIEVEKNENSDLGYSVESRSFSFEDSSIDLSTVGNLKLTNGVVTFSATML